MTHMQMIADMVERYNFNCYEDPIVFLRMYAQVALDVEGGSFEICGIGLLRRINGDVVFELIPTFDMARRLCK